MSGKTTISPNLKKTSTFLGKDGRVVTKKKAGEPIKKSKPIKKFGSQLKQI